MKRSIYVGWDPREQDAWEVARFSLLTHISQHVVVHSLVLSELQARGIYTRATIRAGRKLIDALSIRDDYDGSMATEHACARFLVPSLAREGWALFTDGDVLVRSDVLKIFEDLDPQKAVYCVQHQHRPQHGLKMDGQVQTAYARKNWSSVMLLNCDHPDVKEMQAHANAWPGRDLHAMKWTSDECIGALPHEWNHLVGWTHCVNPPRIVHFTEGTPDMPGYEDCEFAEEWRHTLARCGARRSSKQDPTIQES